MLKTLSLIIMVLVPAAAAGDDESKALLVRLETRYSAPDIVSSLELSVYVDGAVHRRARSQSFGAVPLLQRWRLQASTEQLSSLMRTLRVNRVGFQSGRCAFRAWNPLLGYVQAQVDWFGKGTRQHSFVADHKFVQPCGPEVEAIVGAIEGIAEAAQVVNAESVTDLIEDIE